MSRLPQEWSAVEGPASEHRFMLVSAGGERFGIRVETIREVVTARAFSRLPGAPACVSGIINLRGRIVTVVDLPAALRLPPASTAPAHRVVVVLHRGREVGVAVEDVLRIESVAPEAVAAGAERRDAPEAPVLIRVGESERSGFLAVDTDALLQPLFG